MPWTRSLCPWQVSVPSWIWRGSLQPEWAIFIIIIFIDFVLITPHSGFYPMWHLCLLAKILGAKFSQSPITRSIKCGIWALMGPSNPEDHWTHLGSNSILLTLTKIQEKNWFIQLFFTFSQSFSPLSPFWRLARILSSRRDEFAKFPPIFPINHPPCIPISPSTQSDALWWIFEPKFSQFENFSI